MINDQLNKSRETIEPINSTPNCETASTAEVQVHEQRKYPRRPLGIAGMITWPKAVPCEITDVSGTGACLTTKNVRSIPDEFHLRLNADLMRKCRVVWRKKAQVGIEFV